MRRIATFRNGADYKHIEVVDGGYPVYGSGGEFKRASDYLYDGVSVLFGRKGTIGKPLLVSGRFWTVDTMFFTELSPEIEPRYLHYYATTMPFDYYSTSTALPSITQTDLGGHRMPLPPLDVQRAIADFLDRETARIDTLVAEQQRLIDLLRERREATIVEALEGFDTVPLRRLVDPQRRMTYGILQCGDPVEDGVPYIGPSDLPGRGESPPLGSLRRTTQEIASAYQRSVLAHGDVVVSIGPAYGKVAVLDADLAGANLTQDTVRVAALPELVDTRYLVWVLLSRGIAQFWDLEIMGATFRRLNLGTLARTPIPIPGLDQQRSIAAYLNRKISKIDTLIAESERFIELAQERRAALITAAVTGQIGVREVA